MPRWEPLGASGAGWAVFEVGAVEVSAAMAAGTQLGEFEEVVLDAFLESLVAEFWEAGDDALDADACLYCADERFWRVHCGPRPRSRRLP
jgi:hypothetical protein